MVEGVQNEIEAIASGHPRQKRQLQRNVDWAAFNQMRQPLFGRVLTRALKSTPTLIDGTHKSHLKLPWYKCIDRVFSRYKYIKYGPPFISSFHTEYICPADYITVFKSGHMHLSFLSSHLKWPINKNEEVGRWVVSKFHSRQPVPPILFPQRRMGNPYNHLIFAWYHRSLSSIKSSILKMRCSLAAKLGVHRKPPSPPKTPTLPRHPHLLS